MKKHPVVHFEMSAENSKRMCDFYNRVFGWETNEMGPEFGNYITVITTDSNDKGPLNPGAINGGFYLRDQTPEHPSIVIAVDDVNECLKAIKEAGGKILGEPVEIPGVGLYASFLDTESNRVSVLQPKS